MNKKRVLIVDDVPQNLHVLMNTLKNDYAILVATDGQKALNIVNESNIDIILLDIMMPDMDGFEVCKRLKENNTTKDIPVIFVSALDDTEAILKGFELGGVDYVSKPFDVSEVQSRVKTHLMLNEKRKELEKKLAIEIEQTNIQKRLLIQQEKMASMGEMIGMIAHQWKQPLSSINIITANLQADQELDGVVSNDTLTESIFDIRENIKFMDDTIQDFREFFKSDKDKSSIFLEETIDKTLKIIGGSLKKHNITVDYNSCHFEKQNNVFANEITQVVLNIIKNGMDVITENKIKDGYIKISGLEKDNIQTITIEDNGGGINKDILNNIFKSGFTTKDKSNGSGLGLYMSKIIIEEHCNGKLEVKNGSKGAIFSISLPILEG